MWLATQNLINNLKQNMWPLIIDGWWLQRTEINASYKLACGRIATNRNQSLYMIQLWKEMDQLYMIWKENLSFYIIQFFF